MLNYWVTSTREWTLLRSCPMVHPYQVWPRSEKNCTHESGNGLSKSKLLSHHGIPGVTLCFCTGSYAAAPPAAASCPRDNFWTTFWISFIFGTIVGPDLKITWLDFGRFPSWPWPRFFKVKYGICYISAKNGPIAMKRKANISIELYGSNVTIGFDLGHDLDLEFSRSNMKFVISQPKMVRLPRNEKQTYQLNS